MERARRAIRVFFLIRELSLTLNMEAETQLPLTNPANCVQVDNVLDLSNNYFITVFYLIVTGTFESISCCIFEQIIAT